MRTKIRRLALLGMLMGGLLGMGLVAPVNAAGTTQISGSGYYDDAAGTECGVPPEGFDSYPGLVLSGDLVGCLSRTSWDSSSTKRRAGSTSRPAGN